MLDSIMKGEMARPYLSDGLSRINNLSFIEQGSHRRSTTRI